MPGDREDLKPISVAEASINELAINLLKARAPVAFAVHKGMACIEVHLIDDDAKKIRLLENGTWKYG